MSQQPSKNFQSDIDCRRINEPVRPGKENSGGDSGKVFRTDIDCRRINEPIKIPNSNIRTIVEVQQEVIPIIFVPGIMGSRLEDEHGRKVWDPDSAIFMLGKFGALWQNAKKRKERLVGDSFKSEYLKVIEKDSEQNKKYADFSDQNRADRGWCGVSWNSYGKFLLAMQKKQWEPLININFATPVHAFGYNWTACNGLAGEQLAKYIDNTIADYKSRGRNCEKVILVSHSMGGLVARAACQLHGADSKVLGVIHGVQPAKGSAAAYWRMKGGFERPHDIPEMDGMQWIKNSSKMVHHKIENFLATGFDLGMGINVGLGNVTTWVLGTDGEEVTSLLGNMPGGLELLPNKSYKDNNGNRGWLLLKDHDGKETRLPKVDPYKEIYSLEKEFYRLVNPDWLNPGSKKTKVGAKAPWDFYLSYLKQAKKFHTELADKVHHDTYQFYSTGIASADRVVFTRTLDTPREKGKRLLEIVKNEWFDKATDAVADGVKDPLTDGFKDQLKQILLDGLKWTDVILHPTKAIDLAKNIPKNADKLPGAFGTSIKGLPSAAKGIPKSIGIGVLKTAVMNGIGLLVRDSRWYINRGGYRDTQDVKSHYEEVNSKHGGEDKLFSEEAWTNEGTRDCHPVTVASYLITMEIPNGAGDGTVPESSARALNLTAGAEIKRSKKGKLIRRTLSIGDVAGVEKFKGKDASRIKPKKTPMFNEGYFDRGHEPIYKTKSAQHITFTAIENLCRRRLEALKQGK